LEKKKRKEKKKRRVCFEKCWPTLIDHPLAELGQSAQFTTTVGNNAIAQLNPTVRQSFPIPPLELSTHSHAYVDIFVGARRDRGTTPTTTGLMAAQAGRSTSPSTLLLSPMDLRTLPPRISSIGSFPLYLLCCVDMYLIEIASFAMTQQQE